MNHQEHLAAAFVGLADTLVADYDPVEFAQQLIDHTMGQCHPHQQVIDAGHPPAADRDELDTEARPRRPDRHPEQQVGERQVGEQLPVAGQPVQVVDVGRPEPGVLFDEIAQGGHAPSVPCPAPPPRSWSCG